MSEVTEDIFDVPVYTGCLPIGVGRIPPTDPDLLELEARGEKCEESKCLNTACYGECCFPPLGYGEFGHVLCHDHMIAFGFREAKHRHRYVCACGASPNARDGGHMRAEQSGKHALSLHHAVQLWEGTHDE